MSAATWGMPRNRGYGGDTRESWEASHRRGAGDARGAAAITERNVCVKRHDAAVAHNRVRSGDVPARATVGPWHFRRAQRSQSCVALAQHREIRASERSLPGLRHCDRPPDRPPPPPGPVGGPTDGPWPSQRGPEIAGRDGDLKYLRVDVLHTPPGVQRPRLHQCTHGQGRGGCRALLLQAALARRAPHRPAAASSIHRPADHPVRAPTHAAHPLVGRRGARARAREKRREKKSVPLAAVGGEGDGRPVRQSLQESSAPHTLSPHRAGHVPPPQYDTLDTMVRPCDELRVFGMAAELTVPAGL
eukprot:scaffold3540_cov379-Prasinococcus_capsulatus_cf.AAC.21